LLWLSDVSCRDNKLLASIITQVYKRYQAAVRVASNVDRGPLARKRDVGFIYHHEANRQLQREAEAAGIEFPFRKSV
jgi:hypothetical protein